METDIFKVLLLASLTGALIQSQFSAKGPLLTPRLNCLLAGCTSNKYYRLTIWARKASALYIFWKPTKFSFSFNSFDSFPLSLVYTGAISCFEISCESVCQRSKCSTMLAQYHSSSSCHAARTDLFDLFLPPVSIAHLATSCIGTDLLYIGSCWSYNFCSSMWRGSHKHIAYKLVLIFTSVSRVRFV